MQQSPLSREGLGQNPTVNKSDLAISGSSMCLPSVSPPSDPLLTRTLSHTLTLPIDGVKSLQPGYDEERLPQLMLNTNHADFNSYLSAGIFNSATTLSFRSQSGFM